MEENTDKTCYIKGDIIEVKGYDNNDDPTPVKCKVTMPGQVRIGIEILDEEIDSGKKLVTNLSPFRGEKRWLISTSKIIKNLNSYFNDLKSDSPRPLDRPIIAEQN